MKPYNKTIWKDHVVDTEGAVIQQGTPQSATNFNNIEDGVFANDSFNSVLVQEIIQNKRNIATLDGEIISKTLTNNQSYPFNNSLSTVSMTKLRDTTNYRVAVEVENVVGGFAGDIKITEKALNGFKISFSGSATSVILKLYVQGGIYS